MARPKVKLIFKGIRILEHQQALLDTLLQRHGFVNETEVFRQALSEFYNKREPRRSPRLRLKDQQAQEQMKIATMDDEAYCKEVVKGVVAEGDGGKYVLFHGWANDVRVVEVGQARQFFEQNDDYLANHLVKAALRPVLENMDEQAAEDLKTEYGINLVLEDGKWRA